MPRAMCDDAKLQTFQQILFAGISRETYLETDFKHYDLPKNFMLADTTVYQIETYLM